MSYLEGPSQLCMAWCLLLCSCGYTAYSLFLNMYCISLSPYLWWECMCPVYFHCELFIAFMKTTYHDSALVFGSNPSFVYLQCSIDAQRESATYIQTPVVVSVQAGPTEPVGLAGVKWLQSDYNKSSRCKTLLLFPFLFYLFIHIFLTFCAKMYKVPSAFF